MKNIHTYLILASFGIALCSCSNDESANIAEPDAPFSILATIDQTRTSFVDGESISWEAGDNARMVFSDGTDYWEANSAQPLSEATFEAAFKFNITDGQKTLLAGENGKAWLFYNSHDNGNAKGAEFRFQNTYTQSAPGVMLTTNEGVGVMKLISEPIVYDENENTATANMNILGTIVRFLVYSSTGKYADENVQSVQLLSYNEKISGPGAVIKYIAETGKYEYEGAQHDDCKIYWGGDNYDITVSLANALSLDGVTEAKQGTGIYMSVPPIKVVGYKYMVTTDKAEYLFDAPLSVMEFKNNVVKNVKLNLENSNAIRFTAEMDTFGFDFRIDNNKLITAEATTNRIGFCTGILNGTGDQWGTLTDEQKAFFTPEFKFTDLETGETISDWTCEQGSDAWFTVTPSENTAASARNVEMTVVYPYPNGYKLDGARVFTRTLIQAAKTE